MPVARNTDPETSHEAAASVRNVGGVHKTILNLLHQHGPMTDEEIFCKLTLNSQVSPSGARSRRAELVKMSLVLDAGFRRLTAAKRQTIVWRISIAGLHKIA